MKRWFKAWFAAALPLILNGTIARCPAATIRVLAESEISGEGWKYSMSPADPLAVRFDLVTPDFSALTIDNNSSSPAPYHDRAAVIDLPRLSDNARFEDKVPGLEFSDDISTAPANQAPGLSQVSVDIVPVPPAAKQIGAGLIGVALLGWARGIRRYRGGQEIS
jgi:hypothetical protein